MELQSGAVRIASYRQKLPRKTKNIYLPTEVWVDVFCFPWISRPKMGQIVPLIGNRWLGDQLQFYLHEWGKHTMGHLCFKPQGVSKWHNYQYQPLEYPQTAMPENIKFCTHFQIDHFDNRVFNFFCRIQRLLTANTKLSIQFKPRLHLPLRFASPKHAAKQVDNVRTILGHLLPFMDGVHTLRTDDWMLPIVKSIPPEVFHKVKVFVVKFTRFVQSAMQPIMEWLASNNEPKLLYLNHVNDDIPQQVLEAIRKQFNEATESSTFAVSLFEYDLLDFKCENGIGEQLSGVRNESGRVFEVFRHQANTKAGDQLRQWVDGIINKEGYYYDINQCISLRNPTIGPGNIYALPDLDEDEADDEKEEEEDEKPSTSKMGRICK